jgi:hypothetical protein
MNDPAHLKTWNVYQSAWGPVDEEERRRLLGISVADDILYTDPVSQARGLDRSSRASANPRRGLRAPISGTTASLNIMTRGCSNGRCTRRTATSSYAEPALATSDWMGASCRRRASLPHPAAILSHDSVKDREKDLKK